MWLIVMVVFNTIIEIFGDVYRRESEDVNIMHNQSRADMLNAMYRQLKVLGVIRCFVKTPRGSKSEVIIIGEREVEQSRTAQLEEKQLEDMRDTSTVKDEIKSLTAKVEALLEAVDTLQRGLELRQDGTRGEENERAKAVVHRKKSRSYHRGSIKKNGCMSSGFVAYVNRE